MNNNSKDLAKQAGIQFFLNKFLRCLFRFVWSLRFISTCSIDWLSLGLSIFINILFDVDGYVYHCRPVLCTFHFYSLSFHVYFKLPHYFTVITCDWHIEIKGILTDWMIDWFGGFTVFTIYKPEYFFGRKRNRDKRKNRFVTYEGPPVYPPDLAKFANFGPDTEEILPLSQTDFWTISRITSDRNKATDKQKADFETTNGSLQSPKIKRAKEKNAEQIYQINRTGIFERYNVVSVRQIWVSKRTHNADQEK